ncbi:DUF4386 domain-containing protein [Cellulomonas fimi]|uniref:DUF4386 domain-containing protein n=1 Tax=Cellulomonas fimi TaxID=1708 RepID=A0A7Y0LZS9_CELFI|nr:DUF4386 domain-containing protein [Cellulomonas fimi]NMR20946.1 DUF4386 domain-containing protein [Cellulomonas fimi]
MNAIGASPTTAERSVRRGGLLAGTALLVMAVLAPFGALVAVEGLVTVGDAAATTADVMASHGLFVAGVVTLVAVIALDVVVSFALYRVLAPVHRAASALAAALRLAYSGVYLLAVLELVEVLRVLDTIDGGVATAAQQTQVAAGMTGFSDVWDAGLVLFGLHLLVLGVLAVRAPYVPSWLGVLLMVAGVGYAVDAVGTVLPIGLPVTVSTFTFVGELLLALWLVIRGRRITLGGARPSGPVAARHAEPSGVAR